eukprot:EG_transcript_8884
MIPLSATLWYSLTAQAWLPSGSHILQQDAAGNAVVADAAFATLLKSVYSNHAIIRAYVEATNIWLFFAITGLNAYTLAGYALLVAVMVPCIIAAPYTTPSGLANTLCILLTRTVTYTVLALIVERMQRLKALAEDRLLQEMRAAQTADAHRRPQRPRRDVAGHIETFCGGSAPRSSLEDALACLRRGMRICKERQVFLQLAAGEYRPMQNAVPLREFGEQLVAGRNVVCRFLDLTVYLDSALLSLILDNAISNAFKHGCPGAQQVEFAMAETPASQPDHRRIEFLVQNAVDPSLEPLTTSFVDGLLLGKVLPKREVPVLSNGIGLSHALMAARLAGVTIDLAQHGDAVVFTAWVEVPGPSAVAAPLEVAAPNTGPNTTPEDFPRGLRFFVLDDSNMARRYLQFLIGSWCDPGVVRCFGAAAADVEAFVAQAAQGADVVIVDQHLEYDGESFLGTEVVERLRWLRFPGFICIRSAEDSSSHQQKYLKHGAHCAFSKDTPGARFITELKEAFVAFRHGPPDDGQAEEDSALERALARALHPRSAPPSG